MNEIVKNANALLKPLGLEASGIYKCKRGLIITGCLIDDPDEPLDDCMFILENNGKFREYGFTENPEELTEATMNLDNILYSRKGGTK